MEPARPKPLRYHNFILRLWQASIIPPTALGWRYSLENPHTGERTGFNSIEAMMRYLQEWTVATNGETE